MSQIRPRVDEMSDGFAACKVKPRNAKELGDNEGEVELKGWSMVWSPVSPWRSSVK